MSKILKSLYKTAIQEQGMPLKPIDAARLVGMSRKSVYRYLKAGSVMTPAGAVPFTRDSNGMVSGVRLECIKALVDAVPRPGRRFETHYKKRRNQGDKTPDQIKGGNYGKRRENLWRLSRILAMIDHVETRDELEKIRDFARKKFNRL